MFIYCASWKLWRSRVKSIITVYTNPFDIPVKPQSGQTNDYNSISCFSARHAVLRRKSKDGLAQNQGNVSEWGDMSIHIMWFRMYLMLVIHSLTDSHQIYTKQYLHSNWEEANTKFVVFGLTWRGTKPQTFTIEANTITLAIYTKCTVCICRHYLNNHLIALFW